MSDAQLTMHDVPVTDAVIFDLFGTLTGFESQRGAQALALANTLGVSAEDLTVQLRETYDVRARGQLGELRDQIATLARLCGVSPSEAVLDRAVEIRMEGQWAVLQPRPGALEVLAEIRSRGLRLGVLSDCTDEIPILWPTSIYATYVDAAVFSCSLGTRKPDPRMYAEVMGALGVRPEKCLYVGDGGSSELPGAKAVGIRAVLLSISGDRQFRSVEIDWDGESVHSLEDVLALVVS